VIGLLLTAVKTQAADAVRRAQRIIDLREQYRQAAAAMMEAIAGDAEAT
jgi:hypothetical protein